MLLALSLMDEVRVDRFPTRSPVVLSVLVTAGSPVVVAVTAVVVWWRATSECSGEVSGVVNSLWSWSSWWLMAMPENEMRRDEKRILVSAKDRSEVRRDRVKGSQGESLGPWQRSMGR